MKKHLSLIATIAIFVLMVAGASLHYKGFFSFGVFLNLLRDNAFLGVAAVGMTFVILSGGIDLSVGGMIGFTSILLGVLITKHHFHPAAAIGLSVAIGTAIGTSMGYVISAFDLPPFLVTLACMFLTRGLALVISPDTIAIDHPWYDAVSSAKTALPLIFLTVLAVGLYIAHARPFGRAVYAIGGNADSAALMGLPVGKTKIKIYAISGLCSSIGGVLLTFYMSSGDPNAGRMLELDAIAAVVIGGTLLSGGVGSLVGTLFGVLILGVIQTAITFQGNINSWWTKIVTGILLFGFILLQKVFQLRKTDS
ncbi:MAG: sugar ABC transporter permease YjfF [Fimbriimonas sp.]|nr:sugar ABC transporter permease YjfF [Fimbriimonas sp.]